MGLLYGYDYYTADGKLRCKCAYVCLNCGAVHVQPLVLTGTSGQHAPKGILGANKSKHEQAKFEALADVDQMLHDKARDLMSSNFHSPRRLKDVNGLCPKCQTAQLWSDDYVVTDSLNELSSVSKKLFIITIITFFLGGFCSLAHEYSAFRTVMMILAVEIIACIILKFIEKSQLRKEEQIASGMIDKIDSDKYARCAPIVTDGSYDLTAHMDDPRCQALAEHNEFDCVLYDLNLKGHKNN